jgi:alpha-beta hydrolase superfamily lysophospholipase
MAILHDEQALTRRAVPGPSLYVVRASPEGEPKATVGLLHGYAEHAARYLHVMDAWAEANIASIAIDMRGHGRAAGRRGYCSSFEEFLEDAAELTRLVHERSRGGACFLFGHSFGGLVASASAIESPGTWRGLILSAPYFGLAIDVPRTKLALGRVAALLAPKLALPSGLRGSNVTRDRARATAYDADPLVFNKVTARWFRETELAQQRFLGRAGELRLPLYEVFGTEDRVAKLSAGRAFFDRAASLDKTWRECPGGYHEVLSDPDWRALADEMAEWILARA